MNTAARGRVVFTGRVIVDLTMEVDQRPPSGSEGFADAFSMTVGGGFHTLNTARRLGATAEYVGGTGTGPLGDVVRQALHHAGIITSGYWHESLDTGFRVTIRESDKTKTRLNTKGAEVKPPLDAFDAVNPGTGDVVFLSGYTLYDEDSVAAVLRLVERMKQAGKVGGRPMPGYPIPLIDPTAMFADLPREALWAVQELYPIWTMNVREARVGAERLQLDVDAGDTGRDLSAALSDRLESCMVIRAVGGTWVADGGEPRFIKAPEVEVTHPQRLSQVHMGALAAELAMGSTLDTATAWANAAAARAATIGGLSEAISRQNLAPMVERTEFE